MSNIAATGTTAMTKHVITRVRHEPRRRLLTVQRVERITPNMARVTLGGDLTGFVSSAYDDHVKVFFPLPGQNAPTIPEPGSNGAADIDGVRRSPGRDYTPRRYDVDRSELVIDFALHDAGPATDWAMAAKPGQQLSIGGPRGSFVVPDDSTGISSLATRPPCPR
jgi:NADPH-dependent ferric siderophore reductase